AHLQRRITMAGTVHLHRVFRAPPERVYRAFLDPDALVKWNPPHGFTARVHHMDAREGGSCRISFTNFSTGASHAFTVTFTELVPNQRIRSIDRFDGDALPGEMTQTIELRPVACGTELKVTQEGIPDPIPLDGCYLGWQESLALLAQLVEAEIPDAG